MKTRLLNNKFLKNIAIVSISNFLKLILGFLLIPLYVHYVSPEDLGKFDLIISFLPILNQFISLGLTNSIGKFYLESNNIAYLIHIRDKLFRNTFICVFILLLCYLLFYDYINTFIELYLFSLFLVMLLLENITFVQYKIYTLHENYKKNSIVALMGDLTRYTLIILCVIILEDKLLALFLGSISSLVYIYLQTYYDNKVFFKDKKKLNIEEIIALKDYSTPLIFLGLSGFLYLSLDRIMVGFLSDSIEQVGYLGLAQRLSTILNVFLSSVALVLGINMFKTKDMDKLLSIQNKYILFLLFIVLIIVITYLVFELQIIKYILTENYKNSFIIGIILIVSLFWNKSRENLEFYFLLNNKTKLITKVLIIFTIINLILNFYFIPIFNALGAVIATNISFFLHLLVMLYLLKRNNHKINILPFFIAFIFNVLLYMYLFCKGIF